MFITRFAPSPTGRLHLGHAASALAVWQAARTAGGQFLLRIEDIDQPRCRPEYEAAIIEDLRWLGLSWPAPARRQSDHFDDYRAALARLEARGLLYPCFCTRADIRREIKASPGAGGGPDGPLYPGTCRNLTSGESRRRQQAGQPFALRLNSAKARATISNPLSWHEETVGTVTARPELLGDAVLARRDIPASYHLAVTVDDHLQGITHVIRGNDLYHSTHLHRLLQALLGYRTPVYRHHPLLRDDDGLKLSKRDGARSLAELRRNGASPAEIRRLCHLDD